MHFAFVIEGDYTRLGRPGFLKQIDGLSDALDKADEYGIISKEKSMQLRKEFGLTNGDKGNNEKARKVQVSEFVLPTHLKTGSEG